MGNARRESRGPRLSSGASGGSFVADHGRRRHSPQDGAEQVLVGLGLLGQLPDASGNGNCAGARGEPPGVEAVHEAFVLPEQVPGMPQPVKRRNNWREALDKAMQAAEGAPKE